MTKTITLEHPLNTHSEVLTSSKVNPLEIDRTSATVKSEVTKTKPNQSLPYRGGK